MRGKGVPQRVRMHRCGNTGGERGATASQIRCFRRDRPRTSGVGKQPGAGSLASPVGAQQMEQFRGEQGLPISATPALTNPQYAARRIDVGDFELDGFADAESGAVQDGQQSALAKRARLRAVPGPVRGSGCAAVSVRGAERGCVRWRLSGGGCGYRRSAGRRRSGYRLEARPVSLSPGTTGTGECVQDRADPARCRSAARRLGRNAGKSRRWSANSYGSGDPPASVVEVGSRAKLLSLVTTSQNPRSPEPSWNLDRRVRPPEALVQWLLTGYFQRAVHW